MKYYLFNTDEGEVLVSAENLKTATKLTKQHLFNPIYTGSFFTEDAGNDYADIYGIDVL